MPHHTNRVSLARLREELLQEVDSLEKDPTGWQGAFTSMRIALRREREATDPLTFGREFILGFLYDALGWTSMLPKEATHVLRQAIALVTAPSASTANLVALRRLLLDGGFDVSPPMPKGS